jgi:hypothetical protein
MERVLDKWDWWKVGGWNALAQANKQIFSQIDHLRMMHIRFQLLIQ